MQSTLYGQGSTRTPAAGWIVALFALFALFAPLITGCANQPRTEPAPVAETPPAAAPLATGSGAVVDPSGLVLTAYHVVRDADNIIIWFADGGQTGATLEAYDEEADLALLRLKTTRTDYVSLAPLGTLHLGQRVFTIGFPAVFVLGVDPKYGEGTISSLVGLEEVPGSLQTSVPIQPGNSGGPLLNQDGHVVGVLISSAGAEYFVEQTGSLPQNVNWAMNAELARALFTPPAPRPAAKSRREAIERAVAASCLVIAWPPDSPPPTAD